MGGACGSSLALQQNWFPMIIHLHPVDTQNPCPCRSFTETTRKWRVWRIWQLPSGVIRFDRRQAMIKGENLESATFMVIEWHFNGILVGLSWQLNGTLMRFRCDFHGIPMGFKGDFNGTCYIQIPFSIEHTSPMLFNIGHRLPKISLRWAPKLCPPLGVARPTG